jgi:homoserine dehydrogenase
MNVPLRLEQVRRTGIRELSEEKIRSVRTSGMRYKLVCRAARRGAATAWTAVCSQSCC